MPNGADRVVGDQLIQTKYYSNARNTVNSAFDKKVDGGQYKYSGMQLEVPKDQYNEAIKVMQQRIAEGKVPNHTNPEDAYKIIRKGNITYNESKLITQGGNITSIKYDVLDGAVQSLPVVGISFAIVFAQAKWSGMDTKNAAILAVKAGMKTLVIGTVVYAGSQQFAKLMTAKIAEQAGKKILAETIAKNFGLVFSFSIIIAPNIFDSLRGRISKQQLLKNTLIAGSGFAAGMAAGAVGGSIVPGVGNIVGAVAGGIAGSIISKKILDNFLPDDRVEMFAQLKEEYIDVVMSMNLSEDEFNKIQEMIFNKQLESRLKDMFQHRKEIDSRLYAREKIIEVAVIEVISAREKITDNDILEAISLATNEYIVYA